MVELRDFLSSKLCKSNLYLLKAYLYLLYQHSVSDTLLLMYMSSQVICQGHALDVYLWHQFSKNNFFAVLCVFLNNIHNIFVLSITEFLKKMSWSYDLSICFSSQDAYTEHNFLIRGFVFSIHKNICICAEMFDTQKKLHYLYIKLP